jgi:hypothetical protein
MVKSGIVLLAGKEKVDVAVGWKLQPAAGTVVGERERESWRNIGESEIQSDDHWNQPKGRKEPMSGQAQLDEEAKAAERRKK